VIDLQARDTEINRLTRLLSARDQEVAQEHYEKTQQLKRMHAYQQAKLRNTQKLMENDLQVKDTEIDRLTQTLSTRDQELEQLLMDLAQKSDDRDTTHNSTVELQSQLAHPKHPKTADQECVKDNQHHSIMFRESYTSDKPQEAIIRLINQEIRALTAAKHANEVAAEDEQGRLHGFISMIDENHTAMHDDLSYIRYEITEFAAQAGKYEHTLVRETDEVLDWWNVFRDDLGQTTSEILEEIATRNCSYTRECDDRIEALTELSRVCGVWERLGPEGFDDE
jgi:hypothetical protein